MDFVTSVKTCFRNYFKFSGRARRSEYWWFYLFTVIGSIVLALVDMATNPTTEIFGTIFSLGVILPTLSAACRRLHDTNRSGWWQLLPLVGLLVLLPVFMYMFTSSIERSGLAIGALVVGVLLMLGLTILLIVWLATDSDPGENRFGPSPKHGNSMDDVFS